MCGQVTAGAAALCVCGYCAVGLLEVGVCHNRTVQRELVWGDSARPSVNSLNQLPGTRQWCALADLHGRTHFASSRVSRSVKQVMRPALRI